MAKCARNDARETTHLAMSQATLDGLGVKYSDAGPFGSLAVVVNPLVPDGEIVELCRATIAAAGLFPAAVSRSGAAENRE